MFWRVHRKGLPPFCAENAWSLHAAHWPTAGMLCPVCEGAAGPGDGPWSSCPNCHGLGRICQDGWGWECPDCEATGWVVCSSCSGRSGPGRCEACGGWGGGDCRSCDGSGEVWASPLVACPGCDGRGRLRHRLPGPTPAQPEPCPHCEGRGFVTPQRGYSCCWSADDLLVYFSGARLDDDEPVVIFSGEVVGTGADGEPLVVPACHPRPRWTTWGRLRRRRGPRRYVAPVTSRGTPGWLA
jgi:hypothetical protein